MLVRYIIVVFVLMLAGCRSIPAPVLTSDTTSTTIEQQTHHRYIRDSIYVDRWHYMVIKDDTVHKHDSTIERYYYYYHTTDTVVDHDTTVIDNTTTVTVERELTTWQKWLQALGYGALGTLASILIAGIFWLIIKLK